MELMISPSWFEQVRIHLKEKEPAPKVAAAIYGIDGGWFDECEWNGYEIIDNSGYFSCNRVDTVVQPHVVSANVVGDAINTGRDEKSHELLNLMGLIDPHGLAHIEYLSGRLGDQITQLTHQMWHRLNDRIRTIGEASEIRLEDVASMSRYGKTEIPRYVERIMDPNWEPLLISQVGLSDLIAMYFIGSLNDREFHKHYDMAVR